jgi:uncharacterized membrane protein HdeD (DUF308 family)
MADHSSHSSGGHSGDIQAHNQTYEGFLIGAVALSIICGFVLVALCSFAFAHTLNVFTGFLGLILGIIAVLIDARAGGKKWYLSGVLLVIFGLITAVNVS